LDGVADLKPQEEGDINTSIRRQQRTFLNSPYIPRVKFFS